jgi:predicted metalloprotease
VCNRILADLQDKKIKGYVTEKRFEIKALDEHGKTLKGICAYYADFLVEHLDGSQEIIEAKGVCTQIFVLKWKLMQAQYPSIKFTLVKK